MQRLTQAAFKSDHQITIGVEFGALLLKIEGRALVRLQIWDTAGQEQFRSITKLFYKNSQAAVVVYDVTKRESFEAVEGWLDEIEENRDQENMLVYLAGNRVDLTAGDPDMRQVSPADALKLARDKGLHNAYETSAKTGHNVEEMFFALAKHLYHTHKHKLDKFVSISKPKP
jgi:Ras-related protein Rab-2A